MNRPTSISAVIIYYTKWRFLSWLAAVVFYLTTLDDTLVLACFMCMALFRESRYFFFFSFTSLYILFYPPDL